MTFNSLYRKPRYLGLCKKKKKLKPMLSVAFSLKLWSHMHQNWTAWLQSAVAFSVYTSSFYQQKHSITENGKDITPNHGVRIKGHSGVKSSAYLAECSLVEVTFEDDSRNPRDGEYTVP